MNTELAVDAMNLLQFVSQLPQSCRVEVIPCPTDISQVTVQVSLGELVTWQMLSRNELLHGSEAAAIQLEPMLRLHQAKWQELQNFDCAKK